MKETFSIEIPDFHQGIKCRLPVLRLCGGKSGALIVVMAGQHGRELNGIGAIAKSFEKLPEKSFSGEVVFLPVMNPIAVRTRLQDFPLELPNRNMTNFENMNRLWKKNKDDSHGVLPWAITECVWDKFLKNADAVLDLHCWEAASLCMGFKKDADIIRKLGSKYYHFLNQNGTKGTLGQELNNAGKISITFEMKTQNYTVPKSVDNGVKVINNYLKTFGIIQGAPILPECQYEVSSKEILYKSKAEGVLVSNYQCGDIIKKGEHIYTLYSLDTLEILDRPEAPQDALVYYAGFTHKKEGQRGLVSSMVYPSDNIAILKPISA